MPSTSGADRPPRRNTRSLDLDDSAAKAAAWVWHLHASKTGITTEGRYISKRRNSSSHDRKSTRFQQEAAASSTTSAGAGGMKAEVPLWDCGSKLYDTFELVSFSNRLDRSLMGEVPMTRPLQSQPRYNNHVESPLHKPGGVLRTLSLPRSLSRQTSKKCAGTASPDPSPNPNSNPENVIVSESHINDGSRECSRGIAQKGPTRWGSVGKFIKFIKKVVVLHKQMAVHVGCKQNTSVIESSQRSIDPIDNNNNELSFQYNRGRSISESVIERFSIKNKHGLPISESISNDLVNHKTNRPTNGSISEGLVKQKKINGRRKSLGEELLVDNHRTKDSNLGGLKYKHLHHHHHHHHHHYLHRTFASESARLSPETMSQICAEKSWFTN